MGSLRINRVKVLRVVLVVICLLLICYIERHYKKYSNALSRVSCPPCSCHHCLNSEPTLPLPLEVIMNGSLTDCGKDDPETNSEMKKDIVALLYEEISLHDNVTSDSFLRTKALIFGAKRTSLHYRLEAEKCNAGVEACEQARETTQVALIEERKLTALWMSRARDFGWKHRENANDYL